MDLNTLYRTVIMDNYKNPKNKGLKKTDDFHFVHLNNPSCGDDMNVEVKIENGVVVDVHHDGHGCSICCSSASVMSDVIKGHTVNEALDLCNDFYEMVNNWMEENGFSLNVDSNLYDGIDEAHSGIEKKYSINEEQKKRYLKEKKFNYDSEIKIRTGLGCKSKKGIIQISPDFSVSLCNKMKKRWNLREVKPDVALNELRELIKKYENTVIHGCHGCIYSKNCSMCLVNAEMIDGELYVPKGYCESVQKKALTNVR